MRFEGPFEQPGWRPLRVPSPPAADDVEAGRCSFPGCAPNLRPLPQRRLERASGRLKHGQLMVNDLQVRPARLNPARDFLQHLLGMGAFVGDDSTGQHRRLMGVLPVDFGGRNVEMAPQAGQQRLEDAAFLLERAAAGKVELNRQHGNMHGLSVCRPERRGKPGRML
jgi:hypothetical protein